MWISYCGTLINLDKIVQIQDGLEDDKFGGNPEVRFYVNEKDYFAWVPNSGAEEVARVMHNIRIAVNPSVDVALGTVEKNYIKDLVKWS